MKLLYRVYLLVPVFFCLWANNIQAADNLPPCDNSMVMSNDPLVICSDGIANNVNPMNNIAGVVGTDYTYVVTDALGIIVLWDINASFYDMDALPPGIYQIYGVSYQGSISFMIGMTLGDIVFDNCFKISIDFIEVEVVGMPTPADAGEDIVLCGGTETNLNANVPTIGTGIWTQIGGPNMAIIDSSTSPNTMVDDLIPGTYVFAWTISAGGVCPGDVSTVNVTVANAPSAADAGEDQILCAVDSISMMGNLPGLGETGLWTQIGGSPANIINPNASNTPVTSLTTGTYAFEWQISDAICVDTLAARDTISLTIWSMPTMADAGSDINVCENEPVEMGANNPNLGETGMWAELSGPGAVLGSMTNPSTTVTFPTAGIYELEWTLSNPACESRDTIQINVSANPTLTVLSLNPPSMIGGNDGEAVICINEGTAPYIVLSNPMVGTYTGSTSANCDSTLIISDLPAGMFDMLVTDANGCTAMTSVNIEDPTCTFDINNITATLETCFENNDGSIQVEVVNGTPPYAYDIGAGSFSSANSIETFSPLPAGMYGVTVVDASLCVATGNITISEPDSLFILTGFTDESAPGASDGTIDICVEGGTPVYNVSISPVFPIVTIPGMCGGNYLVNNLPPGTYTIGVEDANGCMSSQIVIISPASCMLAIDSVVVDMMVTCHGGTNGQLSIFASGDNDFQYSVDGGVTFSTPSSIPVTSYNNLSAGDYNILVMDNFGCTEIYANNPVSITQPLDFFPSAQPTDATTPGGSDGFIDLCVNGATPPYTATYNSTTGTMGAFGGSVGICAGNFVANGLPAGTYDIYITDDAGCMDTLFNIIVNDLDCSSFNIDNVIVNDVSCNGGSTGSITVQTSGGFAPFTFILDDGVLPDSIMMQNTETYTFTGLEAGSYSVSAIHSDACADTYNMNPIVINEPSVLDAGIATENPSAIGSTDGQICITPSGGTAPYAVTASCGTTITGAGTCGGNFYIDNLGAGSCNIQVTDANNCLYTITVNLADPSCASFSIVDVEQTNVTCKGADDATITIIVNGGSGPYEYSIDGGSTTATDNNSMFTFAGVGAGNYDIQITDGQGCVVDYSNLIMITEPSLLMVSAQADSTCINATQGGIDLSVTGATPPYMYFWSTGSTMEDIDQLGVGTYDVTVTDSGSCVEVLTIPVPSYEPVIVDAGIDVSITSDETTQLNGTVMTNQDYTFTWSPNAGLSDANSLTPTAQPSGTVTYVLTVIPDDGCVVTDEVVVTVETIRQLVGLPNAFTPNGDADNDVLFPEVQGGATLLSFYVFNRWGERIHDDENSGWDGSYKGEPQPVGTYVYVLKYMNSEGGEIINSGDVTLLR